MGNSEEVKEPQGIFRFMDLPAELRVCVYSYLLPCNLAIKFQKFQDNNFNINGPGLSNVQWRTRVKLPDSDARPAATSNLFFSPSNLFFSPSNLFYSHVHGIAQNRLSGPTTPHRIQTQILLLNKEVCKETQGLSYPEAYFSNQANSL
jgi:hypothetical protein